MGSKQIQVVRNVIGYGRVSTEEQAREGYSLDSQRQAILSHCAYKKWGEPLWLSDDGVSARTLKRDALQYALYLLDSGEFNTLAVKYLDRMSRSLLDTLTLFNRAEEKGWSIVILDMNGDPVDSQSPNGKLMISVVGMVAQWQSDITSEKTKQGMEQARANGKHIGQNRLIPPDVSRRIMSMYHSGTSFSQMARIFTSEGVLTPHGKSLWHCGTVRDHVRHQLGDKYVPKFRRLEMA